MKMNAFTQNINTAGSQVPAYTNNGAKTNSTSNDPIVDFFFIAGASRTMSENDVVSMFARAYGANKEIALRTALWTRDVRGGAGERETFRRVLRWIEMNHNEDLRFIVPRVPELGRWDDLLILQSEYGFGLAVNLIRSALIAGNGLAAKWMPRKGADSVRLRRALGMTPKSYRKTLVNLTNVVETPMCANAWEAIDLEKLPSVASARYRKAFKKRMPEKFVTYAKAVEKGEAKVNAGAIFPHDVIKPLSAQYGDQPSQAEIQIANAQWNALPDFVGQGSFLPIVDVSGSMCVQISGSTRALDVSVALGMYLAERNKSAFKDVMMTFSENPKLQRVNGTLMQRIQQTIALHWGMSTNLELAIAEVLRHAVANNVPAEDMPKTLLVISDMEFNSCIRGTNYQNAQAQYARAGYEMPNVVFWNVNGRAGNNPVTTRDDGTALVSGFSPAIVKSVLGAKRFSPLEVVLNTVMDERYNLAA
jgi:Domain of unknown function (DUF2828).